MFSGKFKKCLYDVFPEKFGTTIAVSGNLGKCLINVFRRH